MSRFLMLVSFLLIAISAAAHRVPEASLIPKNVDSIRLNVLLYRDKEMSLPGKEEEIRELLGTTLLINKEANKFIKRINRKNSYVYERAMLSHHSLEFNCFLRKNKVLHVEISTLTRNININKNGADPFYGKVSKQMGNYILKLLIRLNLYDKLAETGDTEGIE